MSRRLLALAAAAGLAAGAILHGSGRGGAGDAAWVVSTSQAASR